MSTTRQVYLRILEISSHYFSGRPPICVGALMDDLNISKKKIVTILKELERRDLIHFYTITREAFKLTAKGLERRIG